MRYIRNNNQNGLKLCLLATSFFCIGYSNAQNIVSNEKDVPQIIDHMTASEIEAEVIARYRLESDYSLKEEQRLLAVWKKYVPPYIKLMKVQPPLNSVKTQDVKLSQTFPSSYMLPINGAPFNQGSYGTCTAFSLIGAISQSLFQNSPPQRFLISPSCTLQMETTATGSPSNIWNAGYPERQAPLIQKYGLISASVGGGGNFCNYQYPQYNAPGILNSGLSVPLDTYSSHSFHVGSPGNENFPNVLFNTVGPFKGPQDALNNIKDLLTNHSIYAQQGATTWYIGNYYTVIGFFVKFQDIFDVDTGRGVYPGWMKTNVKPYDGAHDLYVYGYDDNLCANSPIGKQCGFLYLRNSWSSVFSEYLMSYDYFYENYLPNNQIVGVSYLDIVRENKQN